MYRYSMWCVPFHPGLAVARAGLAHDMVVYDMTAFLSRHPGGTAETLLHFSPPPAPISSLKPPKAAHKVLRLIRELDE